MTVPSFSQLATYDGKPYPIGSLEFSYRKIIEWLTSGNYDLTVNNLTGSGTITAPVIGSTTTMLIGNGSGISGITQSGGITQQLLQNGGFDYWYPTTSYTNPADGVSTQPNWSVRKANGAGTAPSVDISRSTNLPNGSTIYSTKLTVTAAGVAGAGMYWEYANQLNFNDYLRMRGQSLSLGWSVQAPVGAAFKVVINDGVSTMTQSLIGTGSYQLIAFNNNTISGVATQIIASIRIADDTGAATTGDYYLAQAVLSNTAAALTYVANILPLDELNSYGSYLPDYMNVGTGVDGDFNSTGNFSVGGEKNYRNFTLNLGHTMSITQGQGLILRCTETLTIEGNINGVGLGMLGGWGAQIIGGVNAKYPEVGTSGNTASGGAGGRVLAGGPFYGFRGGSALREQGIMAMGGDWTATATGTSISAEAIDWLARNNIFINGAGGGGGGTDGTGAAGNDGGHGGAGIKLIAKKIVIIGSPTISLDGNNGAGVAAAGGGAGGGGGGGAAIFAYRQLTGVIPTVTVSKGLGGVNSIVATSNGADGGDGFQLNIQF